MSIKVLNESLGYCEDGDRTTLGFMKCPMSQKN
jgi:hypothetical protein